MADEKVNIIVGVTDKASKAFGGIGKAAGALGKLTLGAAVGGIAALTVGLASSVGEAMAAEDAQADLAAVIKSTGGIAGITAEKANELASSFQDVTRFEDDAILSGEAMLLTFTNIGEDVFPMATEAMLNMAQKFGSIDQAAIQLGKALNDPIAGVAALRRVGIQLSETQEEQIKKFMEVGDVASAQGVILGELETQFGGLAVAAGDTFAGKLDILKNKFGDVKEKIGGALLPVLTNLADGLINALGSPAVQGAIDKFAGWITTMATETLPKWAEAAATAWTTAKEKVTEWWDGTADARAKIGEWYNKFKTETLPQFMSKAAEVWNGFKAKVSDWWEGTAEARQNIVTWYNNFKTKTLPEFLSKAAETWNVFKAKVQEWWTETEETRGNIVGWFEKMTTETLPNFATAAYEKLEVGTSESLKSVTEAWQAWVDVEEVWKDLYNEYIGPLFDSLNIKAKLTDDILGLLNPKTESAAGLWNDVKQALSDILDPFAKVKKWLDDVKEAGEGLKRALEGIKRWLDEVKAALDNLTLPDWLTPGSPTPFELGLRGINDALKDLLPNVGAVFTYGLDLASAPAAAVAAGAPILPGGMGGGTGGSGIVINNYFGRDSVRDDQDIERITRQQEQMLIRRGVRSFAV
ncbi:MAG: hypothetical protein EHM35_04455 [Planctomycetaceae bacterium]|nr:MAG: hypothetical protein EHM35_04455 [Planctomycetaceae bacterium]